MRAWLNHPQCVLQPPELVNVGRHHHAPLGACVAEQNLGRARHKEQPVSVQHKRQAPLQSPFHLRVR